MATTTTTTPTTPQRTRRNTDPKTPPSVKKRLNGLFVWGEWYCNCEPRIKASKRTVKNTELATLGKEFYTCATQPQCGFWLWQDEAFRRQNGVTVHEVDEADLPPQPKTPIYQQRRLTSLGFSATPRPRRSESDSGTEPSSSQEETPTQTLRGEEVTEPTTPLRALAPPSASIPAYPSTCPMPQRNGESSRMGSTLRSLLTTPAKDNRKRKAAVDEDLFNDSFSDMDSDQERELVELADRSTSKRTASANQNPFITPTIPRTIDVNGLPTPQTGPTTNTARTLFPSSNKRQKAVAFDSPTDNAEDDVTEPILSTLRPHNLDPSTMKDVTELLETQARKTAGLRRGRDAARDAVRKREGEIARLQERVRALENKERMYETQLTNMKAGLMKVYHDH